VPDLTDTQLDRLITDLGLTDTTTRARPAPARDPWASIRALAARHDEAYGATLSHQHHPRRPRSGEPTAATYRVLVTGSRHWRDATVIEDALDDAILSRPASAQMVVVHGDCATGADRIADEWARAAATTCPIRVERHPADWRTHGKAAGPIRNKTMVAAGADLVLAFLLPNSRGTAHTIALADAAGIPVRRWTQ
jgi:hypothetical protein